MDDLIIKEALTEEAAGAPFPADAWSRQQALLADSGLFGGASAPLRPIRTPRPLPLLEIVAVAAVLLLALGLGMRWLPTAKQTAQGGAPVAAGGSGSEAPTPQERTAQLQAEMGRLLPPSYWSFATHRVIGLQPILKGEVELRWDRPRHDAELDVAVPKLLGWLHWAKVVEEFVSDADVKDGYLYLHLEGGERIWFARHVSCWTYAESDCAFVVGGDGRPNTLVEQPDLWRYLIGDLWNQDLGGGTMPATGRNQMIETGYQRSEIVRIVEADPALAKAGLKIDSIQSLPRYRQRQDGNGEWHIDEMPVWVVHLGPTDETETHGEIRMIDDRSGVVIWQATTTIQRP